MTRKGHLTVQRKAILDIVSGASDHPTASDVIERLKIQGFNFAYGTVYNSLRYLTDEGLIRELKLDGDASRYDARVEEHQHIVCVKCGKVDEVFAAPPADWLTQIAEETGYAIEDQHFVFKGVCAACKTSKRNTLQ
ncbi:MAG: transcriptional repressor [Paenibacillaceae bacterium]|uniref:Fur family transcriptional regulator n=1 Tax=Paenibacillus cymbidii TaxID=1639034 RepID=UPI00107FF177|nr:transcriptional repressor [Paenibacillus cymbidii]MBO9604535.1 transcriptional repressor [Paenibacillaceae bacterium]